MADNVENHTLKLLEKMREEQKASAERINEKLDYLSESFRSIDQRLSTLELNFAIMRTDMSRVYGRLDSIDKRLAKVEEHV